MYSLSPFPQTASYGHPQVIDYGLPRPAYAPYREYPQEFVPPPSYPMHAQPPYYEDTRPHFEEHPPQRHEYRPEYEREHREDYRREDHHREDRDYREEREERDFHGREDRPRNEENNEVRGHRPEAFDDTKSAFSLALSEVTTVTPDSQMSLVEELMILKAGDNPKFARKAELMDVLCASALLLDLVLQGRVGPDNEYTVTPSKYVLRILDHTPTGSKLADSAISNLARKPKQPPTVLYWLQKASPNLAQSVLWRLVKKSKVDYDPRTFGKDKYPVRAFSDLTELREKIMKVMEGNAHQASDHDLFLTFLYYLPTDVLPQIFADRDDSQEEAHLVAKALVIAIQNCKQDQKHWI